MNDAPRSPPRLLDLARGLFTAYWQTLIGMARLFFTALGLIFLFWGLVAAINWWLNG